MPAAATVFSRAAYDKHTAVSLGFLEKCGEKLYSSQITIDADGKVLDLYRRASPGWKESFADGHYAKGDSFHTFLFHGNMIAIGLCGDLWYEENLAAIEKLSADVIFWRVYTDFNHDVWNTEEKYVYAKQVSKIAPYVLYVSSVCIDKAGDEIARGGAVLFSGSNVISEIPAGKEDVLLADI